MAVDKLVDSTQLDADLTSVANAIRAKSGGSSQLAFPSGFVSEIGNIPTGGGGNDFVITFAQDQNDVWVPDKTLSEIQTAFRAGKTIGGNAPYSGDFLLVYTSFEDDDEDPILYYEIVMPFSDNSAGGYNVYDYYLDSQGVNDDGTYVKYDTSNATATDSDVASGKYYYNSTGRHAGTATSVQVDSLSVTQNGTYTAQTGHAYSPVTVNVSGGGSNADYKAFLERSTNTPTLPSDLTTIAMNACREWASLALTSLPSSVTSIGTYAFYGCTNLALTGLPSGLTTIGYGAFYQCTSLALTSLPSSVSSLGNSSFYGCTNLALTSLPSGITTIPQECFKNCYNLEITTLPDSVTYIGSSAFNCCEKMTSISCNGVITSLYGGAFNGYTGHAMQLRSVSFPNMTAQVQTAFGSSTAANACQSLAFADIGKAASIWANAFANCYALTTLVIRKTDSICTLNNVSAFNNTPLSGYNSQTGTVYVPSALISTYQTANNWKTLYDNGTVSFVAIEGSPYELS